MLATQSYFDVGLERAGPATVVAVRGEVDLFAAPALHSALRSATSGPEPVVVDLEECTFFDSNGLDAVLQAEKDLARDGRTLLVCRTPDGCVERLFEVTVPGHFAPLAAREHALDRL